MLLLLTEIGFWVILVFIQLNWIRQLAQKEPYNPWKFWFAGNIPDKTNSVLRGIHCSRCSSFFHRWFLSSETCVSSIRWKGHFGTNRAYLHFETPKFQEVVLSKTHWILTGKNVHYAPACSLDWFLSRYTRVFSSQLNTTIWKKNEPFYNFKTMNSGMYSFQRLINSQREAMC
jgi:hypothetical protein